MTEVELLRQGIEILDATKAILEAALSGTDGPGLSAACKQVADSQIAQYTNNFLVLQGEAVENAINALEKAGCLK